MMTHAQAFEFADPKAFAEMVKRVMSGERLTVYTMTDKVIPCPVCKSTNVSFVYKMTYGHGDSGFEAGRIMCSTCTTSIGNQFGYGEPTEETRRKAVEIWNKRDY